MKKIILIPVTIIFLFGCKPSQKETIKQSIKKVKKEDICKVLKTINDVVGTFYPESKPLLVSRTVEAIGCKDLAGAVKKIKEVVKK